MATTQHCPWYSLISPSVLEFVAFAARGTAIKLWPAECSEPGLRLLSATCGNCGSGHAIEVSADHPVVETIEGAQTIAAESASGPGVSLGGHAGSAASFGGER